MNEKCLVKSVEWAYPTSNHASKFGYFDTGCWVVEMGEVGTPLKAISAHGERSEAMEKAHKLGLPWCAAFRIMNPEELKA